jgi:hypothetical protein
MYKSFVDHPESNQIKTYTFNAAQVVAYIQPVAFEPEEGQRANLVLDREVAGKNTASAIREGEYAEDLERDRREEGLSPENAELMREEMEREVEELIAEEESRVDEVKWDSHCVLPNGERKHKSAVVAEFNRCSDLGQALSADRLLSVRSGVSTESDTRSAEVRNKDEESIVAARNTIKLNSYVVIRAKTDGDDSTTSNYIAQVGSLKKNWSNKGTQYENLVELGGRVKETGGQERPFFPVEVTADSQGAKNLWVELKWLNRVPGNPDVFQLGGAGGDNGWYESQNILGTINMEPYTGSARTISTTPCPSTGWKHFFIVDRSGSKSVQSLLGQGSRRARQSTNNARAKPATKRKAATSKVPLTRTMSAPTAVKTLKKARASTKDKGPLQRAKTHGGNKRVGKGRARTLQKCMLQPPKRHLLQCPLRAERGGWGMFCSNAPRI